MTSHELPRARPEDVGLSADGLEAVTGIVTDFVQADQLQGAVVGVTRRGSVAYLEAVGYADLDTRAPMQADSIFQMASSTKPILGVAAMMMVEEGRFDPDDDVAAHLPEFADIPVAVLAEPADEDISPEWVWGEVPDHRLVPSHRPVKIRDLLTHTAGLGAVGLGTAVADWAKVKPTTLAEFVSRVAKGPLDFQPGSRWMYSGTIGLDVVARVIEVVADTPFDRFVGERIFEPLDMVDTHWNLPTEKWPRLVVVRNDKNTWMTHTEYFSGSYELKSTTRDYLHFEQMLQNEGTLFGHRVLGPEFVRLMASDQLGSLYARKGKKGEVHGYGMGYTVEVVLDPELANSPRGKGSFGWGGAAGTVSWTDPSRELSVVIMVQQPTTDIADRVAAAVADAVVD